ncbi:hypothetical protein EBR57_09925 [bacterium]|nr:hypothetical protein [bacterium]
MFVMRETALTNMMATQFTAEQKLQLQTFMNALNQYVSYIYTKRPSDAGNLVKQIVANSKSSMVDIVIFFAKQTSGSDVESKNLLTTYVPIEENPNMMAYLYAMLLTEDMSMTRTTYC